MLGSYLYPSPRALHLVQHWSCGQTSSSATTDVDCGPKQVCTERFKQMYTHSRPTTTQIFHIFSSSLKLLHVSILSSCYSLLHHSESSQPGGIVGTGNPVQTVWTFGWQSWHSFNQNQSLDPLSRGHVTHWSIDHIFPCSHRTLYMYFNVQIYNTINLYALYSIHCNWRALGQSESGSEQIANGPK